MLKKVLPLMALLVFCACAGSGGTAGNPGPSASVTPPATPSPSPSPTADVDNLNPCLLITQQEASQLAGATFAAGTLETVSTHSKMCTYGAKTTNVFTVVVAVAPDAATAQAEWAQEEAEAQASLLKLVADAGASANLNSGDFSLPGADRAATGTGTAPLNGRAINISAIYVLKDRVFFTFSDLVLDKPAPTMAQMTQQALTVLARV